MDYQHPNGSSEEQFGGGKHGGSTARGKKPSIGGLENNSSIGSSMARLSKNDVNFENAKTITL